MAIDRTAAESSIVEVLDRVLDKGIAVDAWVRLSVVGIELVTVEARVVVASISTYLEHSPTLAAIPHTASSQPVAPEVVRNSSGVVGAAG